MNVKRWSKKGWKKYPKTLVPQEGEVTYWVTTAERTCSSSFHIPCHPCSCALLCFSSGTDWTLLWSDLAN